MFTNLARKIFNAVHFFLNFLLNHLTNTNIVNKNSFGAYYMAVVSITVLIRITVVPFRPALLFFFPNFQIIIKMVNNVLNL